MGNHGADSLVGGTTWFVRDRDLCRVDEGDDVRGCDRLIVRWVPAETASRRRGAFDACVGRCNGPPMEGRAWLPRITVLLLASVLVAVSSPGPVALAVSRWDPQGDAFVDVWRTSKNKVVIDGAPDRLRFKVIATLSPNWSVSVYLDTRGDSRADYRMRNFEAFGTSRCRIWRLPNGDPRPVRCRADLIDDDPSLLLARLWWSVPRSRLASDKVIRWHVHTRELTSDANGSHDDRAPDSGWYP